MLIFSFNLTQFSVLQRANSLQTDWIQMHAQISQRLNNLVAAHRLASDGFWVPLANLQYRLGENRRVIEGLHMGSERGQDDSRLDPLQPLTYLRQLDTLKGITDDLASAERHLADIKVMGEQVIDLLTKSGENDDFQRHLHADEEQTLRDEVSRALNDAKSTLKDVQLSCDKQREASREQLQIVTSFEVRQ